MPSKPELILRPQISNPGWVNNPDMGCFPFCDIHHYLKSAQAIIRMEDMVKALPLLLKSPGQSLPHVW